MAFKSADSLLALVSHIKATKYVTETVLDELKAPPAGRGITAAVFVASRSNVGGGLNSSTYQYVYTVRFYINMLETMPNNKSIDLTMDEAIAEITEDFEGDFTLGGKVRNIDVHGHYGVPLSDQWGYLDVNGVMFRSVDLTVPCIVDATGTHAP